MTGKNNNQFFFKLHNPKELDDQFYSANRTLPKEDADLIRAAKDLLEQIKKHNLSKHKNLKELKLLTHNLIVATKNRELSSKLVVISHLYQEYLKVKKRAQELIKQKTETGSF